MLMSQTMENEHKEKLRPHETRDLNNNGKIETTQKNKQAVRREGGWSFSILRKQIILESVTKL